MNSSCRYASGKFCPVSFERYLFFCSLFKMFFKNQKKGGRGHYRAYPVCNGLGVKCASCSKENREQQSEKHIIAFSEHGQKKSCPASSQSCKSIYKDVLKT